jgi:hypothetical protein
VNELVSFVTRIFRFCQLVTHMILASPFAEASPLDSATDKCPADESNGSPETSTAVPPEQDGAVPCTNACT